MLMDTFRFQNRSWYAGAKTLRLALLAILKISKEGETQSYQPL